MRWRSLVKGNNQECLLCLFFPRSLLLVLGSVSSRCPSVCVCVFQGGGEPPSVEEGGVIAHFVWLSLFQWGQFSTCLLAFRWLEMLVVYPRTNKQNQKKKRKVEPPTPQVKIGAHLACYLMRLMPRMRTFSPPLVYKNAPFLLFKLIFSQWNFLKTSLGLCVASKKLFCFASLL